MTANPAIPSSTLQNIDTIDWVSHHSRAAKGLSGPGPVIGFSDLVDLMKFFIIL
jgi:hypothetical protein